METQKAMALVIDDQPQLLIMYEDALRLVGYDVRTVMDGKSAINHLVAYPAPRLVILDINMPQLSGRDVYRYMREHEKFQQTTVIVSTANSLMAEEMKPHLTASDRLYIKPIMMFDLQREARLLLTEQDRLQQAATRTEPIPDAQEIIDNDVPVIEREPILTPDDTLIYQEPTTDTDTEPDEAT